MRRLAGLAAAALLLLTGCPSDDDPEPEPTTTTAEGERSRKIPIPDVVGLPEAEARSALEVFDLVVRSEPADAACNQNPGDVCAQVPAAATRVRRGSNVTITVQPQP